MKTSWLRGCVLALAGVAWAGAVVHAQEVRWQSPWKPGVALVYDTQGVEREFQGGELEYSTRTMDRETIRVDEALPDGGLLQVWTSDGARYELLHGDADKFALYQGVLDVFAGASVDVELDAGAKAARVRNLPQLMTLADQGVKPLLVEMIVKDLAKDFPPGLDDAHKASLLASIEAEVRPMGEAIFDKMFSRENSERLYLEEAKRYNEFTGLGMQVGETRTLASTLAHPMGKEPIPALLEVSLASPREDEYVLRWTRMPDPEAFDALASLLQEAHGSDVPEDAGPVGAADMDYTMTGFMLFRGSTGVIELYENRVETTYGPASKLDRRRMLLVGSPHAWDAFGGD